MLNKRALTVSRITAYLKSILDEDVVLSDAFVTGEISDVKYHSSGHIYFTLRDEKAVLSAVMFKQNAELLDFSLENGAAVVCAGRISLYEKSGRYQLYAEYAEPMGEGALNADFERLKTRLAAEGLFDASAKKPLPERVNIVAVVTSPTGAAIHDIISVIRRRSKHTEIAVVPAQVQGDSAQNIAEAVRFADKCGNADIIIVGRGGGSGEDLSVFNDERVVRAVFSVKTPVISAIGHETDYTLTDYAADLRAPTPSAAAEMAVKDSRVAERAILAYIERIDEVMLDRLECAHDVVEDKVILINKYIERMLNKKKEKAETVTLRVEGLSPMKILARGFAAVSDGEETIKTAKDAVKAERLTLTFADGKVKVSVNGG